MVIAAVVAAALLAESVWAALYVAHDVHAIGNASVLWLLLVVVAEIASRLLSPGCNE